MIELIIIISFMHKHMHSAIHPITNRSCVRSFLCLLIYQPASSTNEKSLLAIKEPANQPSRLVIKHSRNVRSNQYFNLDINDWSQRHDFLIVEELALQFSVDFVRELNEEDWTDRSFFNGSVRFIASHVSANPPWTATVDLNGGILDGSRSRENTRLSVNTEFGSAIRVFRPAFFNISVVLNRFVELSC